MITQMLLTLLPGLCVEDGEVTATRVILKLSSTQMTSACPICSESSGAVHSEYSRELADLPWCGMVVVLHLHVRKFFCRNKTCARKIFTERLPHVTQPYRRQTNRLHDEQLQLALEQGGAAAARTSCRQGFQTSAKTHLRRISHAPSQPASTPHALGVDDWAMRKSQTYGTILVDLDRRRPVDLLADRTAATLEQWLKDHPGVEIITRDRSNEYIEGATRGAPDAIQVADRFHLVKNVHEALQRLLERHSASLRAAASAVNAYCPDSLEQASTDDAGRTQCPDTEKMSVPEQPQNDQHSKQQRLIEEHRAKRHVRYCEVQALRADGASMRQISRQLGIHYTTVRRFLADQFPERASRQSMPSILDPHIPYLKEQLMAGQDNGIQLWRDLRDRHAYHGSRALVSRWVAANRSLCPPQSLKPARKGRPASPKPHQPAPRFRIPSARTATWLLVADENCLSDDQAAFVDHLLETCPDAKGGQQLTIAFRNMVKARNVQAFDEWLAQVKAQGIPEFSSFAAGLRRDDAAVRATLLHSYSSAQSEGQITRLKLIKRSMYGRGSFELLRRRVLAA